jgi:Ion channel
MRKRLEGFLIRRGPLVLMCLVVASILASPFADRYPHIGAALALALVFSVLLGARLAANRKIVTRGVLPLTGAWILARLMEGFSNGQYVYNMLAHVLGLVLSCAILWAIFDHFDRAEVTSGVIAEAFISYLVIATAFAQLFWLLNEVIADSFNEKLSQAHSTEFQYFSMITLSGVGYGGMLPVNPFVRLVAAFESMIGIFYVAIVVARLVSAYRPLGIRVNSETPENHPLRPPISPIS